MSNSSDIINNRYEGLLIYEGVDINPNGDPDAEGEPRRDPVTGHGITTGVMVNRRIRDRAAQVYGLAMHIHRDTNIETGILEAARAAGVEGASAEPKAGKNGKGTNGSKMPPTDDRRKIAAAACEKFYDDRMMGAVLSVGSIKGRNIDGVATVMMGRSVYPIDVQRHVITRVCETNDEQQKKQEMGSKSVAAHGVYTQEFFINPHHAAVNGATMRDLAIYLDCMVNLFENKRSGMSGRINVRGLYLFRHESKLGNAPAHTLLERVRLSAEKPETTRSWRDYKLEFDGANMPNGVRVFTIEELLGGVDGILKTLGA